MVLHKNHYFIESPHKDIIETFLLDPQTLACINRGPKVIENAPPGALHEGQGEMEVGDAGEDSLGSVLITEREETVCLPENLQLDLDLSKEPAPRVAKGASEGVEIVYSVEVASEKVEEARKRAIELDYPLLEEYDFRKDTSNTINIELKPTTSLRDYQEKCLCKIFGNGRARSGIVALPCGAGKTLVGITAAATIKKPVFVLCTSSVAVEQWRHQFKLWTTIEDKEISKFTSSKEKRWACVTSSIVISTYSMLSYSGKRAVDSETILQRIKEREWGLLILDEVQVVPAKTFRTVLHHIHAHTKIGLSATLVREDAMISDLHFLIGPKVYEADWLQLAKAGHLAKVQCAEVWCPMTPEFYSEYSASGTSAAKKRLLYMLNPNKFRICESLVRYHEARGDKILVFSDNIYALVSYAEKMGKPYIAGSTKDSERMRIFSSFKYDVNTKTIFISKVGDNSIDLPEANVILQISSHYGSRRQEAQRLGRVLRPKSGNILREVDQFDAFFYSLVSQDTLEMQYSTRRQQFLIDQGYAFKMITDIAFDPNSFFTKDEEKNLLHNILTADDQTGEIEVVSELDISAQWALNGTTSFSRAEGTLSALSGADGLTYTQFTID
uniref:DNA 3'-5' helicase n=1 Tax=Arcella intermedia TaxID=1963864 RepID=A0A6B2KZP5_9EUKA